MHSSSPSSVARDPSISAESILSMDHLVDFAVGFDDPGPQASSIASTSSKATLLAACQVDFARFKESILSASAGVALSRER